MKQVTLLLVAFLLITSGTLFSQVKRAASKPSFNLKGEVREAATDMPVYKVNIEIKGGNYTTTNNAGEFTVVAHIGDELIVRSDNFKTVYYTIKDKRRITVLVEEVTAIPLDGKIKTIQKEGLFETYIDSATYYLKKDAKKSIEFVTSALESANYNNATKTQNRVAFEILGDINLHWKQYDLAVTNYKRSLANSISKRKGENKKIDIQIKLARAYKLNKNYQESITAYDNILNKNLSNYQKVVVYEGLGDAYKEIGDSENSVIKYQKGLKIAIKHKITPKITDLNSKIGEAFALSGELQEANEYFDNSLNLAEKENKKRAVEEKNKVADFYNQSRDFEKEIQLREETLDEIEAMDEESVIEDLTSPLTPQRQNYKIANAFVSQGKPTEAISFLKKSIEEAGAKEDLIVEKDATRKLSEIYKDLGEYDKASESYQNYVELVDELYIKKEQEISQTARFRREIAFKQNRITSLESERQLNESRYQLAFENKELTQKNYRVQQWVIGSLIMIALLLLMVAFVQYKSVKREKYANNLLALKSLRTQMNPHFIFNALNSVNSFIASNDERAANRYLSEFSQLMRSVLENSEEDFIPLENEIELLKLYVKLEHFRFKDKFEYAITVDENININKFVIPPMLLQPYVENAVWHGLRYKKEKGKLTIDFKQLTSEKVSITITDNGIGRKKSKELKTDNQKKLKSKGMGNIQSRITILNEMYKDKVAVFIEDATQNEDEIGTKVVLILKKN